MATSMLGTPSPNNSSIDADKDIIWDNCSPTQHLPMRLRNHGRPEVTDIAQLIKVVPAENVMNVEQNFQQPLLGLWMEHGHDLLTENLKSTTNQRKVKGRKTRSKIGHLRSDVFSSELCKLAKLMERKEDSPVPTEKLKLRSNKVYESPMASRITSTPSQEEKQINFKNKRKSSLNGSNELWGQDEWFEDESFLQHATQIEHDICNSQIYTGKQTNSTTETIQTQPKTNSCQPSHKTPVTRKMRRGKNAFNDESKLPKTKNIFEAGKVNKTEIKLNVPTLPLKPRQLHGTFQNTLRIKSEEIDLNPKVEEDDDEVWDDLDDNELAGLECELDISPPLVTKTECQRSSRAARKCFRFKANTHVDDVKTGGMDSGGGSNLNRQFQKLCSPVTRSMTRDRNNRINEQDTMFSDGFTNTNMDNNNTQCSQEQIEKKRLLAIQRRQQRKQNVSSSIKRSSKQIR